jgi:hypothetical protein
MIDFSNNAIFKLTPLNPNTEYLIPTINSFLIDGETIVAVFKTVRDQVVFTNKRVIAVNVHGLTRKNRLHLDSL